MNSVRRPAAVLNLLLFVLALVSACSGGTLPSGPGSPAAAAQGSPTRVGFGKTMAPVSPTGVGPTATTSASLPVSAGRWQSVGQLVWESAGIHPVVLADGRVLLIGQDATARIWDPQSRVARPTAGLNLPRSAFAAVRLADGRVLVTGGVDNQGRSYSSTYLYDPASETWSRSGLLGTARTGPTAALLHDGRVLVAGGYYLSGSSAHGPVIAMAGFRPTPSDAGGTPSVRADVEPWPVVSGGLASAELYDPSTGVWAATGSLRYARIDAEAVTLADGRILVAGSAAGWGPDGKIVADTAADETAEAYDPKSGTFTPTADFPDVDPDRMAALGVPGACWGGQLETGSLVALPGGDAAYIGVYCDCKHVGATTRSFRFLARSGRWTEIGQPFAYTEPPPEAAGQAPRRTPVVNRRGSYVARLGDGRVLVAGGWDGEAVTAAAEVYDPVTGGWTPAPPMPGTRADAVEVSLLDGSVLLLGGRQGGDGSAAPPSSLLFVPAAP